MQATSASILSSLQNSEAPIAWQQLLTDVITAFNCSTGTIHTLDKGSQLLSLQAHKGIPPFLLPKMEAIPIGKGMAGIAAQRRAPVEMCNLQTDESGVARPAAKETRVEGSIAVPMLLDGELYGTLGIAKPMPYDFTEDEKRDLLKIGEEMSRHLRAGSVQPTP
ncbi:GAF domain-containing protein [Pontibacter actiniarum]|uniref:GAF domain-containing protein n=1 Tax=Pontibacter actiniarum TaxID=323450 RepID=A0A1X9YPA1_9BACT|nr:GAF domain-containing protein [Pontibacter actiniarum]ARS34687.1 GAF domain-containing protein [Pontibacter actiniarum]